jgi:hypothetical protein
VSTRLLNAEHHLRFHLPVCCAHAMVSPRSKLQGSHCGCCARSMCECRAWPSLPPDVSWYSCQWHCHPSHSRPCVGTGSSTRLDAVAVSCTSQQICCHRGRRSYNPANATLVTAHSPLPLMSMSTKCFCAGQASLSVDCHPILTVVRLAERWQPGPSVAWRVTKTLNVIKPASSAWRQTNRHAVQQ